MAIYGKDQYEVENNVVLCERGLEALVLLYQPIISANAISLYLTFNKMARHTNYSALCLYTGLDIEVLEHAIIMLERYRLIKTYKNNEENHYLHVLNPPILPNEFLSHYVYGLELRKNIGNHNFNLLNDAYRSNHIDKNNYVEITEKKVFNINQFNENDLQDVLKNKNNVIVLPTQFNYDLFLNDATNLQFPHILRTKENLNLIGELALLYGISEERMQTLVYRSIDFKNQVFETNKLVERVRREKVVVDESINKYDLPPVAYLQMLQNGAAVSTYNKKLLEELVNEMLLKPEVVNRLIEFVMETQNNRLVRNYILQVATTWKTYDIRSLDQANELIKKTSSKTNRKKKVPVVKRVNETTVKEKEYSEEEKQEIEDRIRRFGEKYGTSKN
ncbi:MAG: hypothetical protein GX769_02030 [Erysipelothrix sp.]|nr:hypothetical protein [Erysipelothrix sp.]